MFTLLACSAFLKEVIPPSDHSLVKFLEELHRVVAFVSGHILDLEFENGIRTFEETLMGAMRTHNPTMTPMCMCWSVMYQNMFAVTQFNAGLLLSRRWRVSKDFFDIFYHRFKVNCTKSPSLSRTLTECCMTLFLVPFVNSRLTFCLPYLTCFGQLDVDKSSRSL